MNGLHDIRYSLRQLRRTPGFTLVAVLSLALGIGANAAIFSLFDQILRRPLPVAEPGRLVNLVAPAPRAGSVMCGQAGECDAVFSYPMFRDLEAAQEPFTGLAAHRYFGASLVVGEQTVPGGGMLVSGSYFPVLGLRPALGRLLGPADDRAVGAGPVAVLSHRFWEARLGSDPDVIGRTVAVNGVPMTIVGVAASGFEGTTFGHRADVFVPITMRAAVTAAAPETFEDRSAYWAYLFARLEPGISAGHAAEVMNRVFRPIIREVEAPLQRGLTESELAQYLATRLFLEDGRQGQSTFHDDARAPLFLLLGVTGIVLLITCANLANLLLARGTSRTHELAIRASLGASRARLVGQLLTETVVLAVLGLVGSLFVARWTLVLVGGFLPAVTAEVMVLELQPATVAWAALLAIGASLIFGTYPALHATRGAAVAGLKASATRVSAGRSSARFRTSLVTAQIALSMALLISAGLFVRSLSEVSRLDLGLSPANVAVFDIHPGLVGYDDHASRALFERVEEELMALPGVTGVSSARMAVLRNNISESNVDVAGYQPVTGRENMAARNEVGPDYFRTLGIQLLAGREFTTADERTGHRVAIVNEAFARQFGLESREVIGRRMGVGGSGVLDMEIVGLVRDAAYQDVKKDPPPTYYTPWRQHDTRGLTFYVATATDPAPTMAAIPGMVRRLDSELPVQNLTTLTRDVRDSAFVERLISTLTAAFAGLATLLAAMGLFGVLAYTVAQRRREIGVRMAMGARKEDIRRMILGQVGWMGLVGGAVGLLAALAVGRAAGSLLFGISGHDPIAVLGGVALLTLVALVAGYLPARRATRVDPMIALREE